jgi:hypothetical protein
LAITVGDLGTRPIPVKGFFGFGLSGSGRGFGFGLGFGAATAEDVDGGAFAALVLGADEPPPLHADSARPAAVTAVAAIRDARVDLDAERVTWFPPWRC